METIGRRLAFARKRAGMRQEDLANALSITRATVVNWETRTKIPIVALKACAKILAVDFEWLKSGEEVAGEMPQDEKRLLSYYRQLPAEQKLEAMVTLADLVDLLRHTK